MSDNSAQHPVNQLDDLVHQRYRLGILAFLSRVERADFTSLRKHLGLTDGNLNRHLALLNEAGFVAVDKSRTKATRTRTWVRLTHAGRTALDAHVSALRSMLDMVD